MFTRSPCTGLLRFLKSGLPATAQKNRAWRITPPVLSRYNLASEPKSGPGFFTTLDRVYLMKRQKAKKKEKFSAGPQHLLGRPLLYYHAGRPIGCC